MNNSVARFKATQEAENFRQIPSNIARQKTNCHVSSQTTRQMQWDKRKKCTDDFAYYSISKIQQ